MPALGKGISKLCQTQSSRKKKRHDKYILDSGVPGPKNLETNLGSHRPERLISSSGKIMKSDQLWPI